MNDATRPPGAMAQLRAWTAIGSQSIGGGPSTLYLMRRILVAQNGWLTSREFTEDWTLSRTSPGMTLVALAALAGRRIGGNRGMWLALGGLLVPSILITLALATIFVTIREQPAALAAIAGMAPATIGLTFAMMTIFARAAVRSGRARWADTAFVVLTIAISLAAPTATFPIIVVGALVGWLALGAAEPTTDEV